MIAAAEINLTAIVAVIALILAIAGIRERICHILATCLICLLLLVGHLG